MIENGKRKLGLEKKNVGLEMGSRFGKGKELGLEKGWKLGLGKERKLGSGKELGLVKERRFCVRKERVGLEKFLVFFLTFHSSVVWKVSQF